MSANIIRYSGSKWELARWFAPHLPAHISYLEPFFGSGAMLFTKPRSVQETVNDLDGEIVNLFAVCRDRTEELVRAVALTPYSRAEFAAALDRSDDPVERARRLLVRAWMSFGQPHVENVGWRRDIAGNNSTGRPWLRLPARISRAAARLRGVQVENQDALKLVADFRRPDVLIYADPPYHLDTRNPNLYRLEMDARGQERLLSLLLDHPGPVLLSGLRHPLYDRALAGWSRLDYATKPTMGAPVESIWLNRRPRKGALDALARGAYTSVDDDAATGG